MSCALPSPENGVCANRRPVNGRRAASTKVLPGQAPLVPLADGHQTRRLPAAVVVPSAAPAAARVATTSPFPTDAPEATFSLAQLTGPVQQRRAPGAGDAVETAPVVAARSGIPTFSEIRLARAAAAGRAPVAEVRIPLAELDRPQLTPQPRQLDLGMDQLLERVRQRTAARRSRAAAEPPAG